jgi:hypothetical protein
LHEEIDQFLPTPLTTSSILIDLRIDGRGSPFQIPTPALESTPFMVRENERPHVGEQGIFIALPPALLDRLFEEDQRAIIAMVGRPVTLVGYDEDGRAELEFDDAFDGSTHHIWVAPEFMAPIQA